MFNNTIKSVDRVMRRAAGFAAELDNAKEGLSLPSIDLLRAPESGPEGTEVACGRGYAPILETPYWWRDRVGAGLQEA